MSATLLQKAQQGDAEAFTSLCAPFEGLVYRHCFQLLRNEADAQDAAQETMLRAWRSLRAFRGGSSIATWLFRIAHNVCLDFLRRPRARLERTSLEALRDEGFEPPDSQPTPESAYLTASEQARLREAIAALPPQQQALLSLRYGDGMAYEQLAEALHMAPGTVKSSLSRARDKLRALLTKSDATGNL